MNIHNKVLVGIIGMTVIGAVLTDYWPWALEAAIISAAWYYAIRKGNIHDDRG